MHENSQKRLLLRRKADVEALIVKIHGRIEIGSEAVVEVRCTGSESAQDRSLEAADVLPLAGDQRASRIGGVDDDARRLVAQLIKRHVGSTPGGIGKSDIERRRNGMVATCSGVSAIL